MEKRKFHLCKNLILLEYVDIKKQYRYLAWFLQTKKI